MRLVVSVRRDLIHFPGLCIISSRSLWMYFIYCRFPELDDSGRFEAVVPHVRLEKEGSMSAHVI